ncbi:hypothetical protein [Fredinandcohnia sp. 179-A 10B2 NHS]|uniref:hypothetical protein n=1 Tax=Fredinandcohnia sp. 179-A 10B2 NHS TaxID=3235176 RepID=UPI0039A3D49A
MNLSFEHKRRLKSNQYAYTTAYRRLKIAIEEYNSNEIYSAIGELLLWIMNAHDWHLKHGFKDYKTRCKKDKKGVLLYGLRHAFNSMKHNMKFFTIHNTLQGFSFDNFSFDNMDFRPYTINWVIKDGLLDEGCKEQQENYVKHLEGKEVLDTFDDVILFLNNEFNKVYFKKD